MRVKSPLTSPCWPGFAPLIRAIANSLLLHLNAAPVLKAPRDTEGRRRQKKRREDKEREENEETPTDAKKVRTTWMGTRPGWYENPCITGFEGGGGDAGLRATARGLLLYGADAPGKRIGLRPEFAMRFPDDVGVRQLQTEVSTW